MKKKTVIGGAAIIVATFAWLLFGGLRENVVFFLTPQELLAKGTDGVGVPVRLGGQVVRTLGAWDYAPSPLWYKLYSGIIPRILDVMRSRGKAKTRQSLGGA